MTRALAVLAVEDALSEAVGRRLLRYASMSATQVIGLRGADYLRSKARSLNRTARGFPVLMITDQDVPSRCAPALVRDWLGTSPEPAFLLRVAVLEVESWVIADRSRFARFLGLRVARLPPRADDVPHPKEAIVALARRSPNRVTRRDLVPSVDSTAKVGPAYSARLGEFVRETWDPNAAADNSPSLQRALRALRTFRGPD